MQRPFFTSLVLLSGTGLSFGFACSPITRNITIVDDDPSGGGDAGSGNVGGAGTGGGSSSGGTGPACTTSDDCVETPATPVCDEGVCIGCRNDDDCGDSDAPACAPTGRCEECVENDDCDSEVCGSNNRCLDPETAVYALALTGSNSAECGTRELPCLFFDAALDKLTEQRSNLVLVPTNQPFAISSLVTIAQTFPVTIYGNGVQLNVWDSGIAFSGTELTLTDVVMVGPGSAGTTTLLACEGAGGTLRVANSRFESAGAGITSQDCHVSIEGSEFRQLGGVGVSTRQACTGGDACVRDVLIERSFFEGMESAVYDETEGALIQNNVVRSCAIGNYESCLDLYGTGTVVRFNTVIESGSCIYTGVFNCVGSDIVLSSNITFRSTELASDGPCYAQVYTNGCTTNGSSIDHALSEATFPGVGNVTGDPLFVDADGGDYRLQEDSPALDAGADDGPDADFDGLARPVGGGFDIGAFERR